MHLFNYGTKEGRFVREVENILSPYFVRTHFKARHLLWYEGEPGSKMVSIIKKERTMENFEKILATGFKFHGHRCPAMPMGLRAGLAAMKALNVERAKDKELFVEAETGKGHAAGCFLDGIMVATGCTYGKSNIKKSYYNKMAFTLIDQKTGRAVRVCLKSDFFEKALQSPFVQKRKAGIPPQDIEPKIADPMINRIISLDEAEFLDIGDIHTVDVKKGKGVFEAKRCDTCGELTFVNKLRIKEDGALVCIPCSGYGE
ncbi:MAG: FmdE family protein [Pseudomonadota bacterium]